MNFLRKSLNYKQVASLNLDKCTDYSIFLNCLEWILQKRFDLSYRLCGRYNSEKPLSPGLACDWTKMYRDGIPGFLEKICTDIMEEQNNKFISAAAIYSSFSGLSTRNVFRLLSQFSEKYASNNTLDELRYINSLLSCERNFFSYYAGDVKKYSFLATLDKNTCSMCGNLDGKTFLVSEKQVGVNCPPMHKGCRCTTISADTPQGTSTRFARDSNGQGIKISASVNWKMWRDKYINKL